MYGHILVTIDGSALSNLALPIAADLACKYGGSLTLPYVVPTPSPPPILSGGVAYIFQKPAHSSLPSLISNTFRRHLGRLT